MSAYSLIFLFCGYLFGTITSPTVPSKNTITTTTALPVAKNVSLYSNYTGPPPTIPSSTRNSTGIPPTPPNNYTGPPPTEFPSFFVIFGTNSSLPPSNSTGPPPTEFPSFFVIFGTNSSLPPSNNTEKPPQIIYDSILLVNGSFPTTPSSAQKSATSKNTTYPWTTTTTSVYQYQNGSNNTNPSNGSEIVWNSIYMSNSSNDYFYFDGSNGNASSIWAWIWGNWGENYGNRNQHKNNNDNDDDDDYHYRGWRRWLWHVLGAFLTAIFIIGCLCCLCGVCECVTSCCCCCCKGNNDQVYNDPQTSKMPPTSAYMPPPRVMEPQICSPGMIVPYNMAYGGPPSYDPFDDPNQMRMVRVTRVSYL